MEVGVKESYQFMGRAAERAASEQLVVEVSLGLVK